MSAFDAISVGRRVLAAESEALRQMGDELGEAFTQAVEALFVARGRIVCTGIGKSGHVARKIAATLASTGSTAMFVHATEASHGDLGMIGADDVILALSKTGETRELADVIAYAKRFHIPLIGMTAAPDSALGRAADIRLQLPDAPEACAPELNAPTTSTTLQIARARRRARRRAPGASRLSPAGLPHLPPGRQARRHAAHRRRPHARRRRAAARRGEGADEGRAPGDD
jgi:arabinose-5-phosphate isomerase